MREFVDRRTADGVPMRLLDGDEARALAPILPDSVLGASYLPARRADRLAPLRPGVRGGRAAGRGARCWKGRRRGPSRPRPGGSPRVLTDSGPISAGHGRPGGRGPGARTSPPSSASISRSTRCASRSSRPSRWPPASTSSSYGPAAVKQYSIFRELQSYRPEAFTTELEDRLGLALLESACQAADGSYLLGIAMDFPGFDWKPDLAGVSLVSGGDGRPRCRSCARRASPVPGPASCPTPPTTCRSSTGPPASTT